jgi:hypothetical protein
MVDNNNIPVNIPKVEEVRYLNEEIPTYEEFLKNYKVDERVKDSYESEINAYAELGKGYGPCYYCPYEVNPHKVAGRHINMCGSLSCSYYRRITGNRVGGTLGTTASVGAGLGFYFGALALSPFTGGASLIAAAVAGTTTSIGLAAGGTAATLHGMTETLNGVENELRLKWESEQNREKINHLQSELNKVRNELKEVTEKRDDYKRRWGERDSDYLREKQRAEILESQLRNLKRDLCSERGCGCGGYCL